MTGTRQGSDHRWLRRAEWFFLLAGLIAIDCYVWVNTNAVLYQSYEDWAFDQTLRGLKPSVGAFVVDELHALVRSERGREVENEGENAKSTEQPRPITPGSPLRPSMLIGRIQIPRLNVAAMVREGADTGTLSRAVGHIPGTALPGAPGNVGLAGHRDTFFRALSKIKKHDVINFTTVEGNFRYQVESTTIVGPRDVGVLAASDRDTLTLVTCYPFYYIGSAPKRFIVRATQIATNQRPQQQRGS